MLIRCLGVTTVAASLLLGVWSEANASPSPYLPVQDSASHSSDSPITQKAIEASIQRIKYKSVGDVDLHLHVFYPPDHQPDDRRPAIVFFFGGGWVGGSPSQFYRHAWYLSQRGMVAACAEYRIKSKHGTTPKECVKDGKSAVRYLRQNAEKLGIDPNKLIAAGGSAGGHVAASTAFVKDFNESEEETKTSSIPQGLILFNAVINNGPGGWGHKTVESYWEAISPFHNLSPDPPPMLYLLGDQDRLIPAEFAQQLKQAYEKQNGRCELLVSKNQGHGYFNRGDAFLETLTRADQFLASLSYLNGPPQVKALLGHLATTPAKPQGNSQNRKKKKQ